ncbi:unnamed protein product [Linum trigynum]|uniref:Uncharacterized protein n=1 Tax=Linum trigynum TaxID=586398 RepID=A0AAV2E9P3_9ROSI
MISSAKMTKCFGEGMDGEVGTRKSRSSSPPSNPEWQQPQSLMLGKSSSSRRSDWFGRRDGLLEKDWKSDAKSRSQRVKT